MDAATVKRKASVMASVRHSLERGMQGSGISIICSRNCMVFMAQNNGQSTDNVQPDRRLDRSNSRLLGHFDRSFLDANIL